MKRRGGPPLLTQKFDLAVDVKFYARADELRWVGICKAKDFYAVFKSEVGVTTGKISESNSTLRSW